jgi:periplasmic copper chaperone A
LKTYPLSQELIIKHINVHRRSSALNRRSSAFPKIFLSFFLAASLLATHAQAQVTAKNAWVRATVPAQKTTGAYMTLTSSEDVKVVGASSPAAARVELHASMSMGGVMQMHAMDSIALPTGKAVELKPGGMHVMLIGLKGQMKAGDKVPIALAIEKKGGAREAVQVEATVRPIGSR